MRFSGDAVNEIGVGDGEGGGCLAAKAEGAVLPLTAMLPGLGEGERKTEGRGRPESESVSHSVLSDSL